MYKLRCKKYANAATLLAICWSLFSGFGIFDFIDARRYVGDPVAVIDYILWAIHATFIVAAVQLHRREKEADALCISEEFAAQIVGHGLLAPLLGLPLPLSLIVLIASRLLHKSGRTPNETVSEGVESSRSTDALSNGVETVDDRPPDDHRWYSPKG